MKVLISAYACEPDKGSEPGVGWNWVKEIARSHDVWVITRKNNAQSIHSATLQDPLPNVHWVFFDLPPWLMFWKKGNRGIHVYYYLWQVGIFFVATRLHRMVRFDVVHHATFVTYWLPSLLVFLKVPFVWGPLGGGDTTPASFLVTLSRRGRRYEVFRKLGQRIAHFDPLLRLTARRASRVLATTNETADRLRQLGARNVTNLSQVALSDEELALLGNLPDRKEEPFRLASIGNLVDLKGFHLGLAAFAKVLPKHPSSEYWIVGDGPLRGRLQADARALGIEDSVRFLGRLPRYQVFEILGEVDVLLHPSLHDSGGGVCAEALAAKRPVVCLALGGPALQVDSTSGYCISAEHPDQAIQEMANALIRLAKDAEHRLALGLSARKKAQIAFRWDKKAQHINEIFKDVHHEGVYLD
jgi:glycosyltransferase involved in cell wall biosynthesis